jgi:hypothetical protein
MDAARETMFSASRTTSEAESVMKSQAVSSAWRRPSSGRIVARWPEYFGVRAVSDSWLYPAIGNFPDQWPVALCWQKLFTIQQRSFHKEDIGIVAE